MEMLILSCGTGGGHNAAGRAVLEELTCRGIHAQMFNPYVLRSERLAQHIDKAYVSTAQRAPKAFGAIYGAGELYRRLPVRSPVYYANHPMVSRMQEYFSAHPTDVVIMPHLFPAEIITNMKRQGMKTPKSIFVATDYCCTPFTEETDCDAYITPAADLAEDFTNKGIPAQRLHPFGIPTSRAFRQEMSREEAQRQLSLPTGQRYILLTGGSFGGGKLEKMIELLQAQLRSLPDVQLVVICGSNQILHQKLKSKYGQSIVLVGHTDQMALYLRACHLYLSKPGGLSSTEAAVSGIPLVHISPIPGCETRNAAYFQEHGMSLPCEATPQGVSAILELLNSDTDRSAMTHCQRQHINPLAAKQICDLAEQLAGK